MWFRNDLRMHDNEALAAANREGTSLLPVFCFDPREFGSGGTAPGARRRLDTTGPYRAQFVLDAVAQLRDSLRAAGSDLIIRIGKPEEVLLELAKKVGAGRVYCQSEVSYEECGAEERVAAALKAQDVALKPFWGSTLHSPDALPFKVDAMPSTHGAFCKAVASLPVNRPEAAPAQLHSKPLGARGIAAGDVPTLAQLGLQPVHTLPGCSPRCRGGEAEGLAQVGRLLSSGVPQSGCANFSASFSAQVSPWLATGCLSPRRMYAEVQAKQVAGDEGVAALARKELLWRDFFRFTASKHTRARVGAARQPSGTCEGAAAAPPALHQLAVA